MRMDHNTQIEVEPEVEQVRETNPTTLEMELIEVQNTNDRGSTTMAQARVRNFRPCNYFGMYTNIGVYD